MEEKRQTFLEFARDMYRNSEEITITEDTTVPEKYKDAVNKIANKYRDNSDLFSQKAYSHMQKEFTDDVDERIEAITDDGDIPDGILNTLAMNIYGGFYNNLVDTDAKAIINALAVYIILSSNSKEENAMNTNENIPDPVDVITSDESVSVDDNIIDVNTTSTTAPEAKVKPDCIGETMGDIEAIPVRLFNITEAEVTRHLMNKVLHCPIKASYEKFEGVPGMPYVIMKVAIPAKYAIEKVDIGSGMIVDMVKHDGGNLRIKQSLINDITPFRFPKFIADGSILRRREEREQIIRRGIANDDLVNLIKFSKPCVSRDNGTDYVCIYLRPERIIAHMLSNKANGKPYGKITIENVKGGYRHEDSNTTDPITWFVVLNCLRDPDEYSTYELNIEELFRNAISE